MRFGTKRLYVDELLAKIAKKQIKRYEWEKKHGESLLCNCILVNLLPCERGLELPVYISESENHKYQKYKDMMKYLGYIYVD